MMKKREGSNIREHFIGILLILIVSIICAVTASLKMSEYYEERCVKEETIHVDGDLFRCVKVEKTDE